MEMKRKISWVFIVPKFTVKEMEDNSSSSILDGQIVGIRFGLGTQKEICTASISDSSIGHPSQLLGNPFLGLPLEFGRCESCGTSEPGKCEGHFGYIELPIPVYHPSHIGELKKLLSLLCLKCLKLKSNKFPVKDNGVAQKLLPACCEEATLVSIGEVKMTNGACCLQLKLPAKFRPSHGFWNFLERYGFRYGDRLTRTLLPCEVKEMLKKIPAESRKKLAGKGYFPQDGYILEQLPVPPNCLSVPDISDGVSVMSMDLSITMLKKVLKQVEIIKSSRSGAPNFESHEVEVADLQSAVGQYLEVRGTAKVSRDIDTRYGISQDSNSSTKAWLEKMRTLFIRKGSGFSSRSVITGDAYKRVNEIGVPFEIAQRITFEERVNSHNITYLQELVDNKLCLTYGDGSSIYSLREGSKGHTFLRIGQVVHRRIMDGDIVFINRPPTTHKHSLQALSVYIHDDHTVKINPLICGPLSADFDGDCIHLFYPQSLAAKAEVVELFSVEKQLLSSHSGYLNLQLATDSLLSLKVLFKKFLLKKEVAQQLAMFVLSPLPPPALKGNNFGSVWTASQMLQTILPDCFDCCGERYLIRRSEVLELDFNRDIIQSLINEIVTSIFFEKGPVEVLKFFDSLQPFLMENLFMEGFSVGLEDFSMSKAALHNIEKGIQKISPLLHHLRSTHNELAELQLEKEIRIVKSLVSNFILKSSAVGDLIDSKSDAAVSKAVQQIGFLGLQLSDRGKFYSKTLFDDVASHFESKYPLDIDYPSAKYGLVKGCFFHGLDPYEEMVHSISSREVIVRSSRGLSEPGTLFKNLMAVLRDVVICYDGTVRNVCSNSIIQFEYGVKSESKSRSSVPAGEPVGVLAATAMSNPAYKAVLDSSPSSNSSWDMMKEILLCKVGFKNDVIDRRVILYLNDCDCGRKYCREHAAYTVKNHLKKVSLKDTAVEFLIEYKKDRPLSESFEIDAGLVAHVHLNQARLKELEISMQEILQQCQETIKACCKKKKLKKYVHFFKHSFLSVSESCSFQQSCADECSDMPCLMFFFQDASESQLDKVSYILANIIYPFLLDTIIKGDPRISSANIVWISPDTTTWIRNPSKTQKGELAVDVVLEKSVVKQSGDAWRIVLDSCLPVLHIIDTRRSVPYAIKQIQELLGIACAFEQAVQVSRNILSLSFYELSDIVWRSLLIASAVHSILPLSYYEFFSSCFHCSKNTISSQHEDVTSSTALRLSTSVTMVAKGVRKEHLILLANSMTCTGNLLGFNSGGYKALSRSLNVQVPFTEATLFTPRKCFEKAAEKCHTDNLSSVVASVSWGKNVAVGTGSKFDILLDRKMVGFNQEDEMDVYNFLNMVRSSAGVEEVNNGCLGAEVDDLETDDEMDWNLSPEKDSAFDKPVFEDSAEYQNFVDNDSEGLNWQKGSHNKSGGAAKSDPWSGWNNDETQDKLAKSDPWSGLNKDESHDKLAKSDSWSSWNKDEGRDGPTSSMYKEASKSSNWDSEDKRAEDKVERIETSASEPWSGWGAEEVGFAKIQEDSTKSSNWKDASASWGKKNVDTTTSWGRKVIGDKFTRGKTSEPSPGWDTTSAWEAKAKDKFENVGSSVAKSSSVWCADANVGNDSSWGAKGSSDDGNDTSWGEGAKGGSDSSWGPSSVKGGNDRSWGQGAEGGSNSSWGGGAKGGSDSSWGQGSKAGYDSLSGQGAKGGNDSSWGLGAKGGNDSSWGQDAKGGGKMPKVAMTVPWGQMAEVTMTVRGGKVPKVAMTVPWGQMAEPASSSGWDLPNARDDKESEKNQWGQPRGIWKGKKNNRPPRSPAPSDSTVAGQYTVTRQRLDMFTSEEQAILSDVEPIMQSIRRIMHQSGYKDGDQLSADDKMFIVDNVFNYHPEKAIKMGAGIDHITYVILCEQYYSIHPPSNLTGYFHVVPLSKVNKHIRFQDTRCFYVVSSDGSSNDFSYRKCLDNFIRGKYPDLADDFLGKYFRKPHNGGNNRERSLPPVLEENKE
ncbi:hypothetical protein Pint_05268 [Pistacia integerrima]|uniref:Uncharacterized protein n=1 Tax=Pistacia integerrima TaxID=434235 RepID=A0ACC0Z9A1_9ROSI|nr:hypothetical protein Pint_05268 [Pistacia integerrima]